MHALIQVLPPANATPICSCIYSFCQILLLSAHAFMHFAWEMQLGTQWAYFWCTNSVPNCNSQAKCIYVWADNKRIYIEEVPGWVHTFWVPVCKHVKLQCSLKVRWRPRRAKYLFYYGDEQIYFRAVYYRGSFLQDSCGSDFWGQRCPRHDFFPREPPKLDLNRLEMDNGFAWNRFRPTQTCTQTDRHRRVCQSHLANNNSDVLIIKATTPGK